MALMLFLLPLLVSVTMATYGYEVEDTNLLENGGFEEPLGSEGFRADRATAEIVSGDCHTGSSCLKLSARSHRDGGFVYEIAPGMLSPGKRYYFSLFVKFLTNATVGSGYCILDACHRVRNMDGKFPKTYVGRLPFMLADGLWHQIGGDFAAPSGDYQYMRLHLSMQQLDVNLLVDSVSLIEWPADPNWKSRLQTKIDQVRKNDITVNLKLPTSVNPSEVTVQVEQKRHDFGFGSAIKAPFFLRTGDLYQNYKQFVYDNFNWVVFENRMKWRSMESWKGRMVTNQVDDCIADLRAHNVSVRGHAVGWDIQGNNPDWLASLTGPELEEAIFARLDFVCNHFKGKLVHWDVSNEFLHSHFYEVYSGRKDLLFRMFQRAHAIDPDVKLYLNDYQLMKSGQLTSAQADLARHMKLDGIPIGGIGIQGHMRDIPITVETMENRLAIIAAAEVPIVVTEFSVHHSDESVKAAALEEAFYVFFAEPLVDAIVLWGFSDQSGFSFAGDMHLTLGPDFTPNLAGRKMLDLIHTVWCTQEKYTPSSIGSSTVIRGYHGSYTVSVYHGSNLLTSQDFYLSKGNDVSLTLSV